VGGWKGRELGVEGGGQGGKGGREGVEIFPKQLFEEPRPRGGAVACLVKHKQKGSQGHQESDLEPRSGDRGMFQRPPMLFIRIYTKKHSSVKKDKDA
jgi:hypothetical protein